MIKKRDIGKFMTLNIMVVFRNIKRLISVFCVKYQISKIFKMTESENLNL